MIPEQIINVAAAKKAVDLRWPSQASQMARNTIRDEDYVASHLDLAAAGVTHDELLVALYWQLAKYDESDHG